MKNKMAIDIWLSMLEMANVDRTSSKKEIEPFLKSSVGYIKDLSALIVRELEKILKNEKCFISLIARGPLCLCSHVYTYRI